MLEHIHSFLVKRPLLTLIIFLVACAGTCLVPLAGIRLTSQTSGESAQGTVLMLTSLVALICLGTVTVLFIRSPTRSGPSLHDALIACGFVQTSEGKQRLTYLNTVDGKLVTAYHPMNVTRLTLDVKCSSDHDVTFWTGKVPAIIVPFNWLFGRKRVPMTSIPDDVLCMASKIEWVKSLLENPQVRDIVMGLLADSGIASMHSVGANRKALLFTLNDFQTGAVITPDNLQKWVDALSDLAEIIEKQAGSST